MQKLIIRFNPVTAKGIMCGNMISVRYDGVLYDCDFNKTLGWSINRGGNPITIYDFGPEVLLGRNIGFGDHCLGCTAGTGSGCTGTITE